MWLLYLFQGSNTFLRKDASAKQFEEATRKNWQKYENQVKAGEILSNEEKEKRREAYEALGKYVTKLTD